MNDFLSIVKNLQNAPSAKTDNVLSLCIQNFIDTQNSEGLRECLKLGLLQPRLADDVCCETTAQQILCQGWAEGWKILCQTAVKHHDFSIQPLMLAVRSNPQEAQILIDAVFANIEPTCVQDNLHALADLSIFQNNPKLYAKCCSFLDKDDGELVFPYSSNTRLKTAIDLKRVWALESFLIETNRPHWYTTIVRSMVGGFSFETLLNFEQKALKLFPNTPEVDAVLLEEIFLNSTTWQRQIWEWAQIKLDTLNPDVKNERLLAASYWAMSESLYSEGVISQTEAFRVLDTLWTMQDMEMLEMIFETTLGRYGTVGQPQILRHLSENFSEKYEHCFMQLNDDFPFKTACSKILHQINDHTDALIAQSKIDTDLVNEWREAWTQKQRLHDSINTSASPMRKKM